MKDFNLFIKEINKVSCLKVVKIKKKEELYFDAVCDSKKSKFIKKQETSLLLSSLGIKTPLSKIP